MELTNDQFKNALRSYLEREKISALELSRRVKKGDSTIGDWLKRGIIRDAIRQQVVDKYPWLFGGVAVIEVLKGTTLVSNDPLHGILISVKTKHVGLWIESLGDILKWFLFSATAEERNAFRDSLGDDWTNFLELTRALTNEQAFQITLQEGRLDWCKQQ